MNDKEFQLELLLPRRPLSHQSDSSRHKSAWKDYVYGRAFAQWKFPPITRSGLKFTVVYLCESNPVDINNILKPIQDALTSLIYADDSLITDVTGHLRYLSEPIEVGKLPPLLAEGVAAGIECVYVRVNAARDLAAEVAHE